MVISSLVLVIIGTYLYIHGREDNDSDARFNGAAVLIAGIAGLLLALLWPIALFGFIF